jgi:hypothetical protein
MSIEINPFQQLYVSEAAQASQFVRLFSPVLVKYFQGLFQPGNTVLRGTQGSGKTMLLSLLKPEIRVAYYTSGEDFPVPQSLHSFIGAGINLTRSDAVGVGQRPLSKDPNMDSQTFPLYFADFVNYWIVMDLLNSVRFISVNRNAFGNLINISKLNVFAKDLASDDCWFGYLSGVTDFHGLHDRIKERIYSYRQFHQFNIDELPKTISETKTSIGLPVSITASYLKKAEVIEQTTPIFIRIDQLESLMESDEIRRDLGREYRRVINKALSTRDPAISYKIGSRTYAWWQDLRILRTDAELEHERDYKIADIDEALRRKENTRSILPKFASDVFKRRLINVGYSPSEESHDLLLAVFGKGIDPEQAAKKYSENSKAVRALRLPLEWPKTWLDFLTSLFEKDPLNAKLASAWVRQQGITRSKDRLNSSPPGQPPWPWDEKWWKKERIRQALAQLAAHCGQRGLWAGKEQLLDLSGNNILIFISMCQHIWDAYLRNQRDKETGQESNPLTDQIPYIVQAVGIHSASTYWFNKISEQPGGNMRKRFVEFLGRTFRKHLLDDLAMSYPGHNGFSVANIEFDQEPTTTFFIKQAVNYGILFEAAHTTKTGDRRPRTKWYLNPAYSPHFGIPETHVKEPIYVTIIDLREWIATADIGTWLDQPATGKDKTTNQLPLFKNMDTEDAV